MDTFESLAEENGIYTDKDGKEYVLMQQPYLDYIGGKFNRNMYMASGRDKQGADYYLCWDITGPETGDESDACNWEEFYVKFDGENSWE